MNRRATTTSRAAEVSDETSAAGPAGANGQWKELLARFERELDAQSHAIAARESHVQEREHRLSRRRERLGQLAMAIKQHRKAIVEKEVSLERRSTELHSGEAARAEQAQQTRELERQAEQAREDLERRRAEAERLKVELDRRTKALEHRQSQLESQQRQLADERASLGEMRERFRAEQADFEAQREAFAREQAEIERQMSDREAQVSELEAIHAALEQREAAVRAAEESLETGTGTNDTKADDVDARAEALSERERAVSDREAALESEWQLKLEDVRSQQAELEGLQRQWDERLAELETRQAPALDDEAIRERERTLAAREKDFQAKHDAMLHELIVKRERLAKVERRNQRFADSLENRRAQLRRGRRLLRERWREFYERSGDGEVGGSSIVAVAEAAAGKTDLAAPEVIEDEAPSASHTETIATPRLAWLTPMVCAVLVVGLVALGAGSYLAGFALCPPAYRANSQLAMRLPGSMTGQGAPVVDEAVLAAAMDRLTARNLRPFEDAAAMRQTLTAGPAAFERVGENRYELALVDPNPELAVLIVEAWSESLVEHLKGAAPTAQARFLRRPAYDPTPLAGGEQRRWRMTGMMFAIAASVYGLLVVITAKRQVRRRAL